MSNKPIKFLFLSAAILIAIAIFSLPRSASAQCGAAASSCKDCHEVKKVDSINAIGEWHTAHAFGDFCEFCHSGNIKATDKTAAHVGMVGPLSDVKAACQSCHPNDYMDRAQKYSTLLGKPIGGATTTSASASPVASTAACPPVPPIGGQSIDLVSIYSETVPPPPNSLGNMILAGMVILVVLGLMALIWFYDKPLPRMVDTLKRLSLSAASPEMMQTTSQVNALIPLLESCDLGTLGDVKKLLTERATPPQEVDASSRADLQVAFAPVESEDKNPPQPVLPTAADQSSQGGNDAGTA